MSVASDRPRGAALLAAALLGACGGAAPEPRRPDVVLIVVDTLRADRLSCYGYPRETSPELDRLASEGTLFEDATAQFAWTVPSMVSLFSACYVTDWREVLTEDDPCLAESFQRAGYATLAGIANQLIDAKTGLRGFDTYDVRPSETRSKKTDPESSRDLTELFDDLEQPLAEVLAAGSERPPVFLYLHAYEPHDPYHARKRFEQELPLDGAQPAWPSAWHLERFGDPDPHQGQLGALSRYRASYDHEIRYFDEQLAGVLARLEALGLLERAVIAVASDHGEGLWDHLTPLEHQEARGPGEFFYGQHGATLHQEAIGTPLILWGSGVPAGTRVAEAVENVDLLPTLLELAGLPLPQGIDGRSLVPLMNGAGAGRELVFSYGADGRAMVRQVGTNLKLVLEHEQPVALFDLDDDPDERIDLLAELPDQAERLRAAFVTWREQRGTGAVSDDLIRDDAEDLERLRRLGYMEVDIGR